MNKQETNIEAKRIFEDWQKKRSQIEKDAKEKGNWQDVGFDSNNHLFKDVDNEAKKQLEALSALTN